MFVRRSVYEAALAERDEWRLRAERQPLIKTEYIKIKKPLFHRLMAGTWIAVIFFVIGGSAVPHAQDKPTLMPDYSTCISKAEAQQPSFVESKQKLVNALHICGIFK